MSERLKMRRGGRNIFREIGFDAEEAENLKLRADLMMRIEDSYRSKSGAARRSGTAAGTPTKDSPAGRGCQ